MNDTPLKTFVEEHGQVKAAELIGVSQGAVSGMLLADRKVFVKADPSRKTGFSAYEFKPIQSIDRTGKRKKSNSAA